MARRNSRTAKVGVIAKNSSVVLFHNTCRAMYTEQFYAIIHDTLFSYSLLFWYPYIVLHHNVY